MCPHTAAAPRLLISSRLEEFIVTTSRLSCQSAVSAQYCIACGYDAICFLIWYGTLPIYHQMLGVHCTNSRRDSVDLVMTGLTIPCNSTL